MNGVKKIFRLLSVAGLGLCYLGAAQAEPNSRPPYRLGMSYEHFWDMAVPDHSSCYLQPPEVLRPAHNRVHSLEHTPNWTTICRFDHTFSLSSPLTPIDAGIIVGNISSKVKLFFPVVCPVDGYDDGRRLNGIIITINNKNYDKIRRGYVRKFGHSDIKKIPKSWEHPNGKEMSLWETSETIIHMDRHGKTPHVMTIAYIHKSIQQYCISWWAY